jgi:hypothetical protein
MFSLILVHTAVDTSRWNSNWTFISYCIQEKNSVSVSSLGSDFISAKPWKTIHSLIHTNTQTFECVVCGKYFWTRTIS